MSIKIRPYSMSSKSAKLLAVAMSDLLGFKVFRTQEPQYMKHHTIINWGTGVEAGRQVWNRKSAVDDAIDKHAAFMKLQWNDVTVPDWTTSKAEALGWVKAGHKVYCRTIVNGHEGKGIVVATTPDELVAAPLYTKRFTSGREYRVHVAFGKAIQVVQKKKRNGIKANPYIRSNNNWVFARKIDPHSDDVVRQAINAVNALGLHFGAVDVAYSVKTGKACVLEINTAPGIDQTSAEIYAKAFVAKYKEAR